jgi:hypothetical protein
MINRHKCESHFTGTKSSWWFENANTRLVRAVPMARGRWYPTLLRLYTPPLYSMVALSGHVSADDPGGAGMTHRNDTIELLSSTLGGWTTNPQPLLTFETYPRAFVTPYAGGSIVVASPLSPDVDLAMPSTVLKPVLNQGQFQLTVDKLPGAGLLLRPLYWAFHTSAVLLPLRPSSSGVYPNGRILMTNDVQPIVMNLQELVPDWDDTAARRTPAMRMHANATLLATGDVLVTGGTSHIVNDGWDVSPQRPDQSVRFAEVYREDINRWDEDSGPPAAVPRQYHSIALLLPDGSVLTAGGSKHEKFSRSLQYGPLHEGRVQQTEFFLPWYTQFPACPATPMCRPTIGDSTPEPPRAGNWTITTGAGTPGTSIKRVALIAPGSVTHSFNVDQRYVELRIVPQSATATTVRVVVPDNHYVLPSGWYMLVISRSSIPDGGTQENPRGKYVPSVAKWVRVP